MARIRPTGKEAQFKRHMRQATRRAEVAIRNAARAAHRNERHTVASHLRAMGVDDTTATGMASTLRRKIHGPGVKGYALKDGRRRPCVRYTRPQVIAALVEYQPRKATYKDTRENLLALAA